MNSRLARNAVHARWKLKLAAGTALASLLSACSHELPKFCPAHQTEAISETLYFGTSIPHGGSVSDADWAGFLNTVVTPRFPDGLTVWLAQGQWQSKDGDLVQEPSYVLNVIHPDDQDHELAVLAVSSAYRAQFQQEAVLRVRSRVCTSM